MSRQEDNQEVLEFISEKAKKKSKGTYEAKITFQLGAIAAILADISQSLAIIADKAESEE